MTTARDTEILATAEAWVDGLDPATTPAEDPREQRQIGLAQRDIHAAEAELRRAVRAARDAGYSWSTIGRTLGVTKQAAQERFRQPARTQAYRQPPDSLRARPRWPSRHINYVPQAAPSPRSRQEYDAAASQAEARRQLAELANHARRTFSSRTCSPRRYPSVRDFRDQKWCPRRCDGCTMACTNPSTAATVQLPGPMH